VLRLERLARDVPRVRHWNQKRGRAARVLRAFQAKTHVGLADAAFVVRDDVPADLRIGHVRPGASYPATVRLSNASGRIQSDHARTCAAPPCGSTSRRRRSTTC
jgi:hypothetical protein